MSEEEYETTFSDIMDEYMDHKKYWNFEGDSGLKRLNHFFSDLGYSENNYEYGSPLEEFLSDNPGCVEVMLDWIRDNGDKFGSEWKENLESCLPEPDEDADEEDDEDDNL